jgi:type VII secretion protein EccB
MAARADHLQSHRFVHRRVIAALAQRDPDAPGTARVGAGLLAGVLVAALALAGVAAYGVIRPGDGGAWRDGGAVIVERDSGARFIYRDGLLHPVANYASALLLVGNAAPAHVGRAALAGVPRGVPLGIPGAPDVLPHPADLVTDPWVVCSRPAGSVLLIGVRPGGASAPLGADALLAVDPAGDLHVVWAGRRYAVRDHDVVLAALAWPRQAAVPLAAPLLNALPPGDDLDRIVVPGAGRPSAVDGLDVGDVVVVDSAGGGRQFGLALGDGLAEVTQVQADLLRAGGGHASALSQARYARAPRARPLVPTGAGAPPATTPRLRPVAVDAAVCASVGPRVEVAVLAGDGRVPGEIPVRSARSADPVASAVDRVAVRPGGGAIVAAQASPGDPGGALSLVSDLGVRFPVPSADVLSTLGYAGVTPHPVPAAVVAALPTGPVLDPVAAGRVVGP